MAERMKWRDNPKVRGLHDKVQDILLPMLHRGVSTEDYANTFGDALIELLDEVERGASPAEAQREAVIEECAKVAERIADEAHDETLRLRDHVARAIRGGFTGELRQVVSAIRALAKSTPTGERDNGE